MDTYSDTKSKNKLTRIFSTLETKLEKKWTSNCKFFISTTPTWVKNIEYFIQKKGFFVANGFDKKIELNKQTNETLEEIAKALFRSWFIDFDPVRANAKGLSIGLPNEIIDLFPNSFPFIKKLVWAGL